MPQLFDFINDAGLGQLIEHARREDLGPGGRDVTSELFVAAELTCEASVTLRARGVIAGLALLPRIIRAYDPEVQVYRSADDGDSAPAGRVVATLTGTLRSVLAIERVALNFLGHLSGIATQTASFVKATEGTRAEILDTRKTLPGLRGLQKYAVACGGGQTHRMGLYDAVMVKDNHLAHLPLSEWTPALREMVIRARDEVQGLKFVTVEVDRLEQLRQVLPAGVDIVLLDNMEPATLREAVALRDAEASAVLLEASGGVDLTTVRAIAEAGVDRISVGALTHSAKNLDVGLDIRPTSEG
jgi:nicotinate-nucleotide pyrophosphorylase (carboxylating)